jgi:hypothetical protein
LKLRVTSHSSSKLATSNSLASPESSVLHYLILFPFCIVCLSFSVGPTLLCFLLVFELLSVHNSETATLKQGLHLPRFDLQRLSTPPAFTTYIYPWPRQADSATSTRRTTPILLQNKNTSPTHTPHTHHNANPHTPPRLHRSRRRRQRILRLRLLRLLQRRNLQLVVVRRK